MIRLISAFYREVEFANSSAVTAGQFIPKETLGGSLNAFAFQAFGAAELGTYVTFAEKAEATKVAGDALAFAPGERVHYNVAGAKVSKTASDPLIGYAKRAAGASDTKVIIEFSGAISTESGDEITLADITDLDELTVTSAQVSDLDDTLKALTFAGLADVDVEGVTNNDTLKFDTASGKWVDVAVAD